MNFRILHYRTLDSTNNLALRLAREGAAEGVVVVSDFQTRGRGRFKRRWFSPRGKGLLFSIILRPRLKTSSASILTHVAAQAVRDTLNHRFDLPGKLKRPNDVLVNGKKIAGILTESSGNHRGLDYVVVGIGLNVNTGRRGLVRNATSLAVETGACSELRDILLELLAAFRIKYEAVNVRSR